MLRTGADGEFSTRIGCGRLHASESDGGAPLGLTGPTSVRAGEEQFGLVEPGAATQDSIPAFFRALRVVVGRCFVVIALVPIRRPFPYIAHDVTQSEAAPGLGADLGGAGRIVVRVFVGRVTVAPRKH